MIVRPAGKVPFGNSKSGRSADSNASAVSAAGGTGGIPARAPGAHAGVIPATKGYAMSQAQIPTPATTPAASAPIPQTRPIASAVAGPRPAGPALQPGAVVRLDGGIERHFFFFDTVPPGGVRQSGGAGMAGVGGAGHAGSAGHQPWRDEPRRRRRRRRSDEFEEEIEIDDSDADDADDSDDDEDVTIVRRRRKSKKSAAWWLWALWALKWFGVCSVVGSVTVGFGFATGNLRGGRGGDPYITNSSSNNSNSNAGGTFGSGWGSRPNRSREVLIEILNSDERWGLLQARQEQAKRAVEDDSK